jgi:hypothetical protein
MAEKANRERGVKLNFYVCERELEHIKKKMACAKTKNLSAYLRKMSIDGYILNLNFDEFKEVFANVGKIGGNINQIAKRVNATHNVYADDIAEVKKRQEDLWRLLNSLLSEIKKVA